MNMNRYRRGFELLGLDANRLDHVRRAPDEASARDRLRLLQADVRRAWKAKAFEYHPDRNADCPDAEEKFKMLNSFVSNVQSLKLQPVRKIPCWNYSTGFASGTSASVTSTDIGGHTTVVINGVVFRGR